MRTYTCSLFEPATRLGSQVSPCSYGGFNENIEPERNRKCGLIVELGNLVLAKSCRHAMMMPDDIKVAVNLSACNSPAAALSIP
ncbi:hypothetical protein ACH79_07375 [Bradyrhizobium sp. CCBAU 051011]|nr:hypothetical protein ACH79_07375 [Bradyrhizobium sp. CCBAU 051011]